MHRFEAKKKNIMYTYIFLPWKLHVQLYCVYLNFGLVLYSNVYQYMGVVNINLPKPCNTLSLPVLPPFHFTPTLNIVATANIDLFLFFFSHYMTACCVKHPVLVVIKSPWCVLLCWRTEVARYST